MVDVKKDAQVPNDPAFDIIERMFFGYRDFVGVADAALAATGYGRAHHRVLHFVNRNPGLTVGELLAILKVTKQGLSRTLRALVADGMIHAEPGPDDRREKRLSPTAAGRALADRLSEIQTAKIEAALATLPDGGRAVVGDFLAALVDESEREAVLRRIDGARRP